MELKQAKKSRKYVYSRSQLLTYSYIYVNNQLRLNWTSSEDKIKIEFNLIIIRFMIKYIIIIYFLINHTLINK